MTIHFHTKHFENNPLPLLDYMFLILHEAREDYTVNELSSILKVSLRTVHRLRDTLTVQGYLQGVEGTRKYKLTNKLYE